MDISGGYQIRVNGEYENLCSIENYDSLLIGWSHLNLQKGVNFNGGNSHYCEGENARHSIIDNFGWTISDGGFECITVPNHDR